MRVLVTGASGLIGAAVVRQLLTGGHTVTAVDVQFPPGRLLPGETLELRRADVAELGDVLGALADTGAQSIIHLGYVLPPESERQPRLGLRVNTLGASNVLEAARLLGIARVVYASSVAVYGDQAHFGERPLTEDDACLPLNLYGAAKRLNDMTAQRYAEMYGLDVVGLRIATVFGYGRETGNSAWIGKIASYPAVGQPAHCPLPSWQKSAMIYVDDVAAMLVQLCLTPTLRHRLYLTGGDTCSLAELAVLVRELVPSSDITFDDAAPDFPHVYLIDDRRMRDELRYTRPPLRSRVLDQMNVARAAAGLPALHVEPTRAI